MTKGRTLVETRRIAPLAAVHVCGWNVRWNDMPKSEQDEYILRAERIAR